MKRNSWLGGTPCIGGGESERAASSIFRAGQASPRSLFKPEHEGAILQMHVRKAVRNGWRPNSPQYFLMVARGGWNSLILRHNPLIRAKWRVPVLVPEISYETEKALLLRAGNCYRVVQNLRETEQVIYDYMQGDIKREE